MSVVVNNVCFKRDVKIHGDVYIDGNLFVEGNIVAVSGDIVAYYNTKNRNTDKEFEIIDGKIYVHGKIETNPSIIGLALIQYVDKLNDQLKNWTDL